MTETGDLKGLIAATSWEVPFSMQVKASPLNFAWCVRLFNRWNARVDAPSALRWSDILFAHDTDPRVLEAPRLTHSGFDWTRSRQLDGLPYGPPMEGGPDTETRLKLHRVLGKHSPEGVACAYWLGGSPYVAHLSSRGEVQMVEDLEYVTLHSRLSEIDEVADETVQYPEWIMEWGGSWALLADKDSPFVELAGRDSQLLDAITSTEIEYTHISPE